MYCIKCGAQLVERARFCQECGAPQPELPSVPQTVPAKENTPPAQKKPPQRNAPQKRQTPPQARPPQKQPTPEPAGPKDRQGEEGGGKKNKKAVAAVVAVAAALAAAAVFVFVVLPRLKSGKQQKSGTTDVPVEVMTMPAADEGRIHGDYSGSDGVDMYYGLHVIRTEKDKTFAVITYHAPNGDFTVSVDAVLKLTGDEGVVTWQENGKSYEGTVTVDGDELTVCLNGEKGGWADAENIIRFYPMAEQKKLTESCDLFSVTLPEEWEGKYECQKKSDRLTFIHKASAGNESGGLLFTVAAEPLPDDIENAGFADEPGADVLCRLEDGRSVRYLTVTSPEVAEADAADLSPEEREYIEMASFAGIVQGSIAPAPSVWLTQFDYADLLQSFEGYDAGGRRYVLHTYFIDRIHLTGEIAVMETNKSRRVYGAEITMYGDRGRVAWAYPGIVAGTGVLQVDGGKYTLSLRSFDENVDFSTGGEIALAPMTDVNFDKFYSNNYVAINYSESAYLYEEPVGLDVPGAYVDLTGRFTQLEIDDVRMNTFNSDYNDLWRGRTTIDGVTGWIDMGTLIAADLREGHLTEAEQKELWTLTTGKWTEYDDDEQTYVFIISQDENGAYRVVMGLPDAGADIYCTVRSVSGSLGGMVRLELAEPAGTDVDGDPVPAQNYTVYVDLTHVENGVLAWRLNARDWTRGFLDIEE